MSKAPAFQFYVKDWLSDPQLRKASFHTKGIWTDTICLMWESIERGKLSGTVKEFCKMLGATEEEFNTFLDEAKRLNFATVTEGNGEITLENRRMVRDDKDRKNNAVRQARFKSNAKSNGSGNEKVTPLSSTASPSPKKERVKKEPRKLSLTDEQYFEILKTNPAFRGLDIDIEKAKCEAWCMTNGKVFSRRRFTNWINRAERPMQITPTPTFKRPSPLEEMKREDAERAKKPDTPEQVAGIKRMVAQLAKDKEA